jgi:hypothetical protein
MAEIDKSIIDQVNEWFFTERNYDVGLSLLKEVLTNHKGLIKNLERGNICDNMQHLTYNLFKISDHKNESICYVKTFKPNPVAKKLFKPVAKTDIKIEPIQNSEVDLNFTDGSEEAILLAQIIRLQKKYYNERARAHNALVHHGDNNDSYSVEKRKEYLSEIETLTKQVDYLHNVKQEWKQTGVMPSERVLLWEPEEQLPESKPDIIVDNIPEVDLQSELAKVRSRLSKYAKKVKELSGNKLQAMKAKQTKDEALKAELTVKLNAIRNK